jgi:hypothetical protein
MPETKKRGKPASSVEGREKQLIALSVDLAEKQLLTGKASAQVITHFLKLGTSFANLERETLILNNDLLKAKAEQIRNAQVNEGLYRDAITAMRKYQGIMGSDEGEIDDE